jgi:hypothetical protein
MQNKMGVIIPLVMILFGGYVLLSTIGVSTEQVTLFAGHQVPHGLAVILGLLGVGGGILVILTALTGKTHPSS